MSSQEQTPPQLSDQLLAGIIMNIVAQEERHVTRDLALSGHDLADEQTAALVHERTVENVVKRFPETIAPHVRAMLGGDGLKQAVRADLQRAKDSDWLKT